MPRILILEDERVVARDLQGILTALGYDTSLAASGEEAIGIAKRDQPDLALVDIHLAGALDGIETAQALRQQLDLGIVYLTAHGDEHTLERAEATEPLGFLVKPFAEPTLRATLQMAVLKAGIERRNRVEQRWRTTVLDQLTVGLLTTDATGTVKMMNALAQSLAGWSEQEALGKNITEVLVLRCGDRPVTNDLLKAGLEGLWENSPLQILTLAAASGSETQVENRVSVIQDEDEHIVGLSFVIWPASKGRTAETEAPVDTNEPECDPVTGLPGRAQAIAGLLAARPGQGKYFSAIFMLDRYYLTARKYGTSIADEVFTYYGTYLAQEVQAVPHYCGIFRWTGPCFLAIFGPWDSMVVAQREIARCTRVKLVEEFQVSSHTVLLPVSASVKLFAIFDNPMDNLINQIDSFVATLTKAEEF